MSIYCVTSEMLGGFLNNFNKLNISYKDFSGGIFEGFDFFSPIDIESSYCNFIISVDDSNQDIIGVIKFKRYRSSNHEYLSEEEFLSSKRKIKNYKGIMFVDVKDSYRNKGIATNMIKYLCELTNSEVTKTGFRLGKLTPLGKKANLLSIFKEFSISNDIKI